MLRNLGAFGLACLLLTGCLDPQKRKELALEEEKKRDLDVAIVADVCDIASPAPLRVDGIGLVTGLAGTGHCPHGPYRSMMEQILLKNTGPRGGQIINHADDPSIKQVLDNPNNCLVVVSGNIPPGARKGDTFDLDITLPDGSRATSLAGGVLLHCTLRVWEAAANLSDKYAGSSKLYSGHIFADAKGPLVVGFGNHTDSNELKRGKVWQGGVSRIHRPYSLILRHDEKSVRIANDVARRIDLQYRDDPRSRKLHADYTDAESMILNEGNVVHQLNQRHDATGMGQSEMAKAMNKEVISVRVPFAYRFDHERFLRVVCVTPLRDRDPKIAAYRQRLQSMLTDPRDTILTARRLEALGRNSIPLLKPGLESDHPLVRFASAEALAYLGSTLGVETLTQLAQQHPILVKNCTLALANLGENICRDKLAVLMASDDRALSCAAFEALSLIDRADPRLGGQPLGDVCWLYRVPRAGSPMVYYSTSQRPQVVLFGSKIVLGPDTNLLFGEYTVRYYPKEQKFYVKRFTVQGEKKRVCSNRLDDVVTELTNLGATYPDIVEFLRRANHYQNVDCPVLNWTVPEVTLEALIEAGRQMKWETRAGVE